MNWKTQRHNGEVFQKTSIIELPADRIRIETKLIRQSNGYSGRIEFIYPNQPSVERHLAKRRTLSLVESDAENYLLNWGLPRSFLHQEVVQ